jgi:hypothetical protein
VNLKLLRLLIISLVRIYAKARISAGIEMIVATHAYTADLLTIGKIPLPINFLFSVGNGADLIMHGGKLRGTLRIIAKETEPNLYRCRWDCPGSQYDRREFFLSPGSHSELTATGAIQMVPSPYCLVAPVQA